MKTLTLTVAYLALLGALWGGQAPTEPQLEGAARIAVRTHKDEE